MPSSKALTNVTTGAGKLHSNVATAAADYQISGGTEAILASVVAALNQEIAIPTFVNLAISSGAASVILDGSIYGPVWLGASGETTGDLFDIVSTSDDRRVAGGSGAPLKVTSIAGGSVGSGAFTASSITLNFNDTIPATTTYKILFSKRATLSSVSPGAIATSRRFVPEPAILEDDLQAIKWATAANAWDQAPLASLETLVNAGLNERYNRNSTFPSGSPVVDGAGDGGLIVRTGQAVTVRATAQQYDYSSPQPDPYWAQYMVTAGPEAVSTSLLANYDGGTGFVGVLQQRLTTELGHRTNSQAATLASRLDVVQRDQAASTLGGANVRTKVGPTNTTGTALNPDVGTSVDARRTILLGSGDYFWEGVSGNDLSEVAVGRDMVEVTFPGGEVQAYVITTLFGGPHPVSGFGDDERRALVRTLAGDSPEFPSGSSVAGVSFRFVKTARFEGVSTAAYKEKVNSQTDPVLLNYGYTAVTPPITDDPTGTGSDEVDPGAPQFVARGVTRDHVGGGSVEAPMALEWGGHDPENHVAAIRGGLRGDGAVECTLAHRKVVSLNYAVQGSTVSYTWHPAFEGSTLIVNTSHAFSFVNFTLDLDTDYLNNVLKEGDEITIITEDVNASGRPLIKNWPASFKFSGVDYLLTASIQPPEGLITKYNGIYVNMSGGVWLITTTHYMDGGP